MAEITYVRGSGNPNAKLMVVGEAPGAQEEAYGEAFVGPSGQILNELLAKAGIDRSECWLTNIVKVRPPNNDLKKLEMIGFKISDFTQELKDEIRQVNPNAILALGNLSLNELTGKNKITDWRGSILQCTMLTGYKVIPSIHPANLLYSRGAGSVDYSMKTIMQLDYARAVKESQTKEFDLPDHNLMICRSSQHLKQFLERHEDKQLCSIDIEVLKCIPVCICLAFSRYEAISIPLLNQASYFNLEGIGDYDLSEIWRLLVKFFRKPGLKIIGQNFKFDHQKLLSPCGFPVPNPFADTMFLAHTLHPELPKSLGFLGSVYSRVPFYKNEGKEFNPKRDNPKDLFLYNAKDGVVTFEVYQEMLKDLQEYGLEDFFFEYEGPLPEPSDPSYWPGVMSFHQLYMHIESVGFKVDEHRKKRLFQKYTAAENRANKEFERIVGIRPVDADEQKRLARLEKKGIDCGIWANLSSPIQVKEILFDILKLPKRDSTDEDTLVALLGNHCSKDEKKKRAIELILDLRRFKKTKGTYISAACDYDGRMRTSYRVVGAETGRTSTSKLEPPVRPISIGLAFQTLTKHGDIGSEIRSMFIPDEGHVFLEADQSQAEARVVALLADDDETLELFNTTDIHKLTASRIFGCDVSAITKELRFVGKTVRHAGNYGMGKRRLMQIVNTDAKRFNIDISISEWKAGKILDAFHEFAPRIRGVFHQEIEKALRDNNRVLINPFGRRRQFLGRWDDELLREAFSTIPQGTVGDQTKRAGVALRKRYPNVRLVVEAHDALVALPPEKLIHEYAIAMKEEFERPIDFSLCSIPRGKLIIPAEVQIARKNYKAFEKYEV